VQFQDAELTGPRTWRLTGLLRGQAGTADIAAGGHEPGARFVLLDRAVELLDLSETESWLALTLRCGKAGAVYDPDTFADIALTPPTRRELTCLPPVHLAARRDAESGDVAITWIRQTRLGGDAWEPVEVPLGETVEAYRLEILDGGDAVRAIDVASPLAAYAAADQMSDFGELPDSLSIRVCQISPTEGLGVPAESTLHV
jgi:hypothetical protein